MEQSKETMEESKETMEAYWLLVDQATRGSMSLAELERVKRRGVEHFVYGHCVFCDDRSALAAVYRAAGFDAEATPSAIATDYAAEVGYPHELVMVYTALPWLGGGEIRTAVIAIAEEHGAVYDGGGAPASRQRKF